MKALLPFALGAWVAAAPEAEPEEGDGPLVEILHSSGTLIPASPAGGEEGRWERTRIRLLVANRLPVPIEDLEVTVALVNAAGSLDAGAEETPIPGWRFDETFRATIIPALEEIDLFIDRQLPPQRKTWPASDVAYRARIRRYRLATPDLDLAVHLLGSGVRADQLAAFRTYEPDPETPREELEAITSAVRLAITDLSAPATPSNALELLLALRAAGGLGDPSLVGPMLLLPERIDERAWGSAVSELAARMVTDSEEGDPRLEILPPWARRTLVGGDDARAAQAVRDAVREAIVRIGDRAVPELLRAKHLGATPPARATAAGLLHALGRSTVRSQVSLEDRDALLAAIRVFGEIGAPEPVSALTEMVTSRDRGVRRAALEALERIGPAAIESLADALGTPDEEARRAISMVIASIGPRAREPIAATARRYGVAVTRGESAESIARRLAAQLSEAARLRWTTEIERGLDLGRQGRYDEAFRVLDGAYAADPGLYMRYAEPIARMYLERARKLFATGNYDAAADTVRVGQSVAPLREAQALLVEAQIELARGFLELDQLDKAEAALEVADPGYSPVGEVRVLRARLLHRRAEHAYEGGDFGRARNLLDRARALSPDHPELAKMDRRLVLRDHLALVVVLGLAVSAGLVALAIMLLRRLRAGRIAELESAIDRQA